MTTLALSQLFDVSGKTAIVTGASSGLGETFVDALNKAGANLVLAARRESNIRELADQIVQGGGKALAVPCDVSDPARVKGLVRAALDRFERIDILVNNAAQADVGPVPEKTPVPLFKQIIDVNLGGSLVLLPGSREPHACAGRRWVHYKRVICCRPRGM